MFTLTIHEQTYTAAHLMEALPQTDPTMQTVFDFCRQWLHGEERFTLYTSGSTGQPKPIQLHRSQMEASAHLTGQALGLQAGDCALVCLPTNYIAGRMMLVRGMVLGLHLWVVPPSSNPLAPLPSQMQVDFTALVPLQLQTILQQSPDKLPLLNRMKGILVGGAPLTPALIQTITAISAPLYHTYGMTETVSHVALRRLNGSAASKNFTPLPGVEVGQDERGCLTIRAAVTRGEWLVTNDRVRLRGDGRFEWLGRVDNVINSGGIKVQAERIEVVLGEVISKHNELVGRRFLVGGQPHAELGQMVVAVVEGSPPSAEVEAEVWSQLQGKLSKYERPRRLMFLPHFLETPTAKVDRAATLKLSTAYLPPHSV